MPDPDEAVSPLKSLPYRRAIGPLARQLGDDLTYQEYCRRLQRWETLYILHDNPDNLEVTILTRVDSEEEFQELTADISLLEGVYALDTEDASYE